MKRSFMALITPIRSGAHPDHELPTPQPPTTPPPYPDNTLPGELPHPSHPIYYPLPPGGLPVYPDNSLPGDQPHPDNSLPGPQPHPDHELPGDQPHPDNSLPVRPPDSGGWSPVYINGGPGSLPTAPHPDHDLPVPIPPDMPVPPGIGIDGTIKFKAIWTPDNGWQTIGVIIPSGDKPIVTPSKKR